MDNPCYGYGLCWLWVQARQTQPSYKSSIIADLVNAETNLVPCHMVLSYSTTKIIGATPGQHSNEVRDKLGCVPP